MLHYLKTEAEYFDAAARGEKNFTVRKDDRGFKVGDYLVKMRFKKGHFTGALMFAKVSYKTNFPAGVRKGYVVLGFKTKHITVVEEWK